MLRRTAIAHPDLLGFWLAYEPDAFDGRDRAFAGVAGSTKSGRFSPYMTRVGGKVTNMPVDAIDGNDYYDVPKATRKPFVVQPYVYDGTLMTSFQTPILRGGKFVGVVGIDRALNAIMVEGITVNVAAPATPNFPRAGN